MIATYPNIGLLMLLAKRKPKKRSPEPEQLPLGGAK